MLLPSAGTGLERDSKPSRASPIDRRQAWYQAEDRQVSSPIEALRLHLALWVGTVLNKA